MNVFHHKRIRQRFTGDNATGELDQIILLHEGNQLAKPGLLGREVKRKGKNHGIRDPVCSAA